MVSDTCDTLEWPIGAFFGANKSTARYFLLQLWRQLFLWFSHFNHCSHFGSGVVLLSALVLNGHGMPSGVTVCQFWQKKMAKNDDTITVIFDKVDNNFHIKSRKHFTYFTKYLMTNESKITKNHIVLNSLQLLFRAKRSYSLIGRWWSVLLTGRSFLERERDD